MARKIKFKGRGPTHLFGISKDKPLKLTAKEQFHLFMHNVPALEIGEHEKDLEACRYYLNGGYNDVKK